MAFVPCVALLSARAGGAPCCARARAAGAAAPRGRLSRRALLAGAAAAAAGVVAGRAAVAGEAGTTPSGLGYTAVTSGGGPAAVVGDLVGIRFKGSYNGVVFDNLFEGREPFFYRVGSENILKGIDEAVQFMHVGDVYDLTLPSQLAFGSKGRRASAGKASIPPGAEVNYTLELTSIPGKEDELLELIDLADE